MDFDRKRDRWLVLLGLLLLAAVPRAIMAWRIDVLCPDATVYIKQAEAIESGRFEYSTLDLHRVLYPAILAVLHQSGLEWELAGKLWGLMVSTLVIFPLFYWTRRCWDDTCAVVACMLYGVHPEFIEWSVELIRDATFWLCCVSAVALFQSRKGGLAYGLAGLSGLFRVEGFLLFAAMLWRRSRIMTLTLLLAALIAGVLFPAGPFGSLWVWLQNPVAVRPGNLLELFKVLVSGLHPIYLFLLGFGAWHLHNGARRSAESEMAPASPISAMCALTVFAIWIHISRTGNAEARYALSIGLLLMPVTAYGLLVICRRMQSPRWALIVAVLTTGVVGWTDALTTRYDSRRGRAELGVWLRTTFGDDVQLAGHGDLERIVGFYSGGWYDTLPRRFDDRFLRQAKSQHAVVLISQRGTTEDDLRRWLDRSRDLGLVRVEPPRSIAVLYGGVHVFTCSPAQKRRYDSARVAARRRWGDR